MKVVVVTAIPSPYQVELFDELARLGYIDIHVIYLWRKQPTRPWGTPALNHPASFVDELSPSELEAKVGSADLAVFGWYQHRAVRQLMKTCAAGRKAWCFWGEAPGYSRLGPIGTAGRMLLLHSLHGSDAPIWGIGSWAVERYRREFGNNRPYFNIPYFSNLHRFSSQPRTREARPRTVLYSGALIKRKGVDTLAHAWRQVSKSNPEARLEILGDGPLRPYMEKVLRSGDGVVFHGAKGWSELPSYYARADILCAPSRYDGWGLVVPEALASSMPVIASNRMGASRELIREGENGWLCEPEDEAALARLLQQSLAVSAHDLASLRQKAQQSVVDFDVTIGARRFTEAARKTLQAS